MMILENIKLPFLTLLVLIVSAFIPGQDEGQISGDQVASAKADKSYEICISTEELLLYDMIMQHRKEHKLPEVPLSKSLTYVARQHTIDLATNHPHWAEGCNLHSWSDKGPWTGCCYTSDHKQASCIWDKPGELTNYVDYGFEIAASASNNNKYGITAERAFNIWLNSSSHEAVILNLNKWEQISWQAIGISLYEGYASVWFGATMDKEGEPDHCE